MGLPGGGGARAPLSGPCLSQIEVGGISICQRAAPVDAAAGNAPNGAAPITIFSSSSQLSKQRETFRGAGSARIPKSEPAGLRMASALTANVHRCHYLKSCHGTLGAAAACVAAVPGQANCQTAKAGFVLEPRSGHPGRAELPSMGVDMY